LSTVVVYKTQKKGGFPLRDERDRIRMMLYRNTLTNAWLVNRLEEKGINTEKTEMSSVLRGVRKGAKAESIIKASIEILDFYEKAMGVSE
jgi:hypothetical protein